MKPRELAAAIRKGAAMRPQGFGPGSGRMHKGDSCAPQAAAEAVTGQRLMYVGECCAALGIKETLAHEIWTKNDVDRMTREQIANWLDTLEPETKPADKQSFDAFMATVMQPVDVNSPVFP